ncbi:MAG: hypothetical protein ACU0CI_06320, partial [Shimia sp.]
MSSDLRLQTKIPFDGTESAREWLPGAGLPMFEPTGQADLCLATNFAGKSKANILVPTPPAPAEEEKKQSFELSGPEVSRSYDDIGVREGRQRGLRTDFSIGETTTNPDGTDWSDRDWAGKLEPVEVTILEAERKTTHFDEAVAKKSFGDEDSLFSGSGRALGADSSSAVSLELSSSGVEASAESQANASVIEGEFTTDENHAVVVKGEGSV